MNRRQFLTTVAAAPLLRLLPAPDPSPEGASSTAYYRFDPGGPVRIYTSGSLHVSSLSVCCETCGVMNRREWNGMRVVGESLCIHMPIGLPEII